MHPIAHIWYSPHCALRVAAWFVQQRAMGGRAWNFFAQKKWDETFWCATVPTPHLRVTRCPDPRVYKRLRCEWCLPPCVRAIKTRGTHRTRPLASSPAACHHVWASRFHSRRDRRAQGAPRETHRLGGEHRWRRARASHRRIRRRILFRRGDIVVSDDSPPPPPKNEGSPAKKPRHSFTSAGLGPSGTPSARWRIPSRVSPRPLLTLWRAACSPRLACTPPRLCTAPWRARCFAGGVALRPQRHQGQPPIRRLRRIWAGYVVRRILPRVRH